MQWHGFFFACLDFYFYANATTSDKLWLCVTMNFALFIQRSCSNSRRCRFIMIILYCRAAAKPSRYSSVAAATNSMTNQTQWWCNYYLSIFMCFHFHRRSSGENKKIRLLAKNTHNTTLCAGYLLLFVYLLIMQAKNPNLAVRTNCCILVFMFFGWRILH